MVNNGNTSSASASYSGGIGFTGLLAIVFVVLKLTGVIDWSWWWVLAPLWLGFVLGALLIGLFLFIVAVTHR